MCSDKRYFLTYVEKCKSCVRLMENNEPSQFEIVRHISKQYPMIYRFFGDKISKLPQ